MKTYSESTPLMTLVKTYVESNYWVHQTIVQWLRNKPAESLEKEIASSFPGIKASLVHIWDTERFWLSVIKRLPPPPSFRMNGFHGTLDEVFNGLLSTSQELMETVTTMTEDELTEEIQLKTPWFESTQPRYQYIQHVVNHSSYHRGQVITMGHHVGIHDAPMTDYNYFLVKKQTERQAA